MRLLFTSSPNAVDWLIKLVTGEDCAHMALLFESRSGGGVVFEANLLGTHPAFYKTWMKRGRRIVHSIEFQTTLVWEDAVWEAWVEKFDGRGYDFGGVLYLGLAKLMKRWFNRPLPKKNRWAKRQAFFCDEIYQLVSGLPGFPPIEYRSNGMYSPHDVYLAIKDGVGK